jgi:hypothetical protein
MDAVHQTASARTTVLLPLVLTTEEYAYLVRQATETVRRRIRSGEIEAHGRPARIPSRELRKLGIDLDDAARVYATKFICNAGRRRRQPNG